MNLFEHHLDALIAAVAPTLAIVIATWKIHQGQRSLHIDLNSRLTELIEATKLASHAEGLAEGRAEGRVKDNR